MEKAKRPLIAVADFSNEKALAPLLSVVVK